jgi:hypothetical protein
MILGGVLLGASAYWYYSRPYDARQLVQMLPPDRSSYIYIDVNALRSLGILDLLAGAKSLEEADYEKFVKDTGFDYRTDLDNVAIAFREGDVYYAAQGRFEWAKLESYAPAHSGKCERFLCSVAGSEPSRDVTYYMPRNGILAVAVSKTSTAGDMVAPGTWRNPPRIENAGIWISVLPIALSDLGKVPALAQPVLMPLAQATSAIFTLNAAQGSKDSFELRMQATMKDDAAAKKLADQYTEITNAVAKMLKNDASAEFGGMLAAGKFTAQKSEVSATWPVSRTLLESLAK